MRDAILLIHSTDAGVPAGPGSGFLHWVRRSDGAHMSPVNQMKAGGKDPQGDCAPTDLLSRLLDDGRRYPMPVLEALCGTANGITTVEGLMAGLRRFGYTCHWDRGPASVGWIMNPAWGGLISPTQCGPYITAFTGQSVIIDTPGAWESPPPPPAPPAPPISEDDMLIRFQFNGGAFLSENLMRYRHLASSQILNDVAYVVAKSHQPFFDYTEPLTDVRAFGKPIDQETATAAGDTFP
jgi:hypothetical protein